MRTGSGSDSDHGASQALEPLPAAPTSPSKMRARRSSAAAFSALSAVHRHSGSCGGGGDDADSVATDDLSELSPLSEGSDEGDSSSDEAPAPKTQPAVHDAAAAAELRLTRARVHEKDRELDAATTANTQLRAEVARLRAENDQIREELQVMCNVHRHHHDMLSLFQAAHHNVATAMSTGHGEQHQPLSARRH